MEMVRPVFMETCCHLVVLCTLIYMNDLLDSGLSDSIQLIHMHTGYSFIFQTLQDLPSDYISQSYK